MRKRAVLIVVLAVAFVALVAAVAQGHLIWSPTSGSDGSSRVAEPVFAIVALIGLAALGVAAHVAERQSQPRSGGAPPADPRRNSA